MFPETNARHWRILASHITPGHCVRAAPVFRIEHVKHHVRGKLLRDQRKQLRAQFHLRPEVTNLSCWSMAYHGDLARGYDVLQVFKPDGRSSFDMTLFQGEPCPTPWRLS